MALLNRDQLYNLMWIDWDTVDEYLPHLNAAMDEFSIHSLNRVHHFVSQLGHESGGLVYMEEIADGSAYEWRRDLGNIYAGDGVRYKGRGPIQLTGRHNYGRAQEALGLDLIDNPWQAADPNVGFRIAGWYWDSREINGLADADDFDAITYAINGGYNGYESRKDYLRVAREVITSLGVADSVDEPVVYEFREIVTDEQGWYKDKETNVWLRFLDRANEDSWVDGNGWPRATGTPEPTTGKRGLRDPGSGWYVEQHPTHFNWRDDVKALVDEMEEKYDTFGCTYYDHPPGWGLDAVSVDFWYMDGRGVSLPKDMGDAILEELFNKPEKPDIWWLLWRGWMWNDTQGWVKWEEYDEASDAQHWYHLHLTYR